MKIKIAYQEHEAKRVGDIVKWLKWRCGLYGCVKILNSDKHKPFHHVYITVNDAVKPLDKVKEI